MGLKVGWGGLNILTGALVAVTLAMTLTSCGGSAPKTAPANIAPGPGGSQPSSPPAGSVSPGGQTTGGEAPPVKGTATAVYDQMSTFGDDVPIIFGRDGNLYAVRPDGAAPAPLTNTGYDRVADYLPAEGTLLFIRGKDAYHQEGDVVKIDFRTGRQTVFLPASAFNQAWAWAVPGEGFDSASLLPADGRLLLSEGNADIGGVSYLLSASPDGKDLSPLIEQHIMPGGYAFNPDGSGMAFENAVSDVQPTLIYNLTWNKSPVALITSADDDWNALWAGGFAWRPDGRSIAFFGYTVNGAQGPKNGIYDVTTSGRVTEIRALPDHWIGGLHWLSTDRLAFIATPLGPGFGNLGPGIECPVDFDILDVSTGQLSLLTSFHLGDKWGGGPPCWSWNPAKTAFVFQKDDGSLWVKDLKAGGVRQIPGTKGADLYGFTWGSDPFSG